MTTPDADKKTLSQAAGIPTSTEVLVQKACGIVLGLDDARLAKRGCDPEETKALAQALIDGGLDAVEVPQPNSEPDEVPPDLMEPPVTQPDSDPVDPEADTGSGSGEGEAEGEDRNPGKLSYEDVDSMNKKELQSLAKDCGLSTSGSKTDLFNSVVEYLGLV
jgi:hypothetical protein